MGKGILAASLNVVCLTSKKEKESEPTYEVFFGNFGTWSELTIFTWYGRRPVPLRAQQVLVRIQKILNPLPDGIRNAFFRR